MPLQVEEQELAQISRALPTAINVPMLCVIIQKRVPFCFMTDEARPGHAPFGSVVSISSYYGLRDRAAEGEGGGSAGAAGGTGAGDSGAESADGSSEAAGDVSHALCGSIIEGFADAGTYDSYYCHPVEGRYSTNRPVQVPCLLQGPAVSPPGGGGGWRFLSVYFFRPFAKGA